MMSFVTACLSIILASKAVFAVNFRYENIQLRDTDIGNNSDIAFGKVPASVNKVRCKVFPGDVDWPLAAQWTALNSSLDGTLIKGLPPAAACYNNTPYYDTAKCMTASRGMSNSLFIQEDPTVVNGQWQLGNSCPVPMAPFPGVNITLPTYTCNITAFPAYGVVNATTVKHIQLAVNFARNNNIRISIKNTGHDFLGRNTGGGALQIWTHHLKQFEYLPSVTIGKYSGRAARVGAALQQWELFSYMDSHNITLLAPGSSTVGAYGGFMQGGGFSYTTSKFGLMADQILSLEVVTADGRFVHADPDENEDLFWAIRGGGPGNFGVVTSAVVKAYDPTPISISQFNLQTGPLMNNASNTVKVSDELFWKSINVYFSHLPRITAKGGIGWNNIGINRGRNNTRTFSFTGQYYLPGLQKVAAKELVAPVIRQLNQLGVNLTNPEPQFWETYAKQGYRPNGPGEGAGNSRFASRLVPRQNLADPASEAFNNTMTALRTIVVEGGYRIHSVDYTPTAELAGYPGNNSAVNPALRNAIMHVTSYDTGSYGPDTPATQQIASHKRLNSYMQILRDASPGSGAYMNEADTEEPNFKESFFGSNYERLLKIKRATDPWGAFYVVTGVGSDEWVVENTHGLPTQQGRLCKLG